MWWVEIRAGVRRSGPPFFVPNTEVYKHTGFRSVFAFDDATKERILESGSMAGLRGIPVYADTLYLDFDGHHPTEFLTWLAESHLAYERYDSGGRSVHVHIPMIPVHGSWVPAAAKQWIRKHAPTADVSFIHPCGQYRLPKTFHSKRPGRCKTLIDSRDGQALELSAPKQNNPVPFVVDVSDPEAAREHLFQLLTQTKGMGGRSGHLWLLALRAAEAGLDFHEAMDHLRFWNERFAAPAHDELVLQKQCESAYRKAARSGT